MNRNLRVLASSLERDPQLATGLYSQSAAPDSGHRIRVIEEVPILLGIVSDDSAIEARRRHVIERDSNAIELHDPVAVERTVRVTEPIPAATATRREGNAEETAIELGFEAMGGVGSEGKVHRHPERRAADEEFRFTAPAHAAIIAKRERN